MNKFFAILYDSYKEAISTWVLQVMLGISVLLMLFVSSISFRMITLQDDLEHKLAKYNWLARSDPKMGNPFLVVENVVSSNPTEPWQADYSFDVLVRCDSPENLKLAKDGPIPTSESEIKSLIKKEAYYLKNIQVKEVPPANPKTAKELKFHVTTSGTNAPDRMAWPHEPTIFFALEAPLFTQSLRDGVYTLEKQIVNDVGAWATLLVSVIITAGFIPNMLRKGTLDLYISKPFGRSELLIYKYIGGLTFVAILTTVTIGGVWLVIGLRIGVWAPEFLAIIPLLTFYFAILYAVSTFVAVFTRSSLVAILGTVVFWAVCFGYGHIHFKVGQADRQIAKLKEELAKIRTGGDPDDLPPEIDQAASWLKWGRIVDLVGRPLIPRTYDLDDRGIQLIADSILTEAERKQRHLDQPLSSWWETLGTCTAFIVIMLALSCWRFSTRDG